MTRFITSLVMVSLCGFLSGCFSTPIRSSSDFTPEDRLEERRAARERIEALRQANEALQQGLRSNTPPPQNMPYPRSPQTSSPPSNSASKCGPLPRGEVCTVR